MHQLHYVVCYAKNFRQAEKQVEKYVKESMKPNRSGVDSVSILGTLDSKGSALGGCLYTLEETNINIQNTIKKIIRNKSQLSLVKKFISGKEISGYDWHLISEYAIQKREEQDLKENLKKEFPTSRSWISNFDVLKHSFYEDNFSEFGVTHIDYTEEGKLGKQKFVVLVDCHY